MDQPPLKAVTRAVVWNQSLWTLGYSFTSGGFLLFFARELKASAVAIAVILVLPETVGVLGLLSRKLAVSVGGRKRLFFLATWLSRSLLAGVPLVAILGDGVSLFWSPVWIVVALLALAHAVQAVGYVAYLSLLAQLAPQEQWGRFFAKRNIAKVLALLVIVAFGGWLRSRWRGWEESHSVLIAYGIAFTVGVLLTALSLLPLRKLPEISVQTRDAEMGLLAGVGDAWRNRPLRYLLIHNWSLAMANGLTQSAFFIYLTSKQGLGIGLLMYYMLNTATRCVKLPVSGVTGVWSDRHGHKTPLVWGVLVGSSGLVFWLMATPAAWWWVWGAYFCWGGFAAANIAGRNLLMSLSPRGDCSIQLAMFHQVGGLCAGVGGIFGGWWLEQLATQGPGLDGPQLIILVSLLARWISLLWLIPVTEPERSLRNG